MKGGTRKLKEVMMDEKDVERDVCIFSMGDGGKRWCRGRVRADASDMNERAKSWQRNKIELTYRVIIFIHLLIILALCTRGRRCYSGTWHDGTTS